MNRLFALLTLWMMSIVYITANAQMCHIAGTNGNTIEVFDYSYNEGTNQISVTVSNDSDVFANVSVTAQVTYKVNNFKETKRYSGKVLACPEQTTILHIENVPSSIKLPSSATPAKYDSIEIVSISGNKCQ